MASISDDPNGRKRILFVGADGKRRPIRLGKASVRQAEAFKVKLEAIVADQIIGRPHEAEVATWLRDLDPKMRKRLERAGLATAGGGRGVTTLAAFIDAYVADRTDAKPRTVINFKQARTDLVAFFGEAKLLQDVTEGDADSFWRYLLRRGLAANTARRICGRAKQFFRAAARKRLVTGANPFADLKTRVQANHDRDYFVPRPDAQKVVDACPDDEWRLIFALSRWGGLRCPSEHLALKWTDVDWENNRFTVHSPKTEHHEGKATRLVPLFPELRPHLLAVFEGAPEGAKYVITRYRDVNANLRTQLHRIIRRAGLEPWPKTFHSLRATRETELAEQYPIHVVCEWIGNSEAVAKKHYLQMREDYFTKAVDLGAGSAREGGGQGGGEKAAQKAAQQPAAGAGTEPHPAGSTNAKRPVLPGVACRCNSLHEQDLPPRGVEPLSSG